VGLIVVITPEDNTGPIEGKASSPAASPLVVGRSAGSLAAAASMLSRGFSLRIQGLRPARPTLGE